MKKVWNDALRMPSNSLPDADLNLSEMKTKSPSCPAGEVHMYVELFWSLQKENSSEVLAQKSVEE